MPVAQMNNLGSRSHARGVAVASKAGRRAAVSRSAVTVRAEKVILARQPHASTCGQLLTAPLRHGCFAAVTIAVVQWYRPVHGA